MSPSAITLPIEGTDIEQRERAAREIHQDSTLVLVGCGEAKRDPGDPTDLHVAEVGPDETIGQIPGGDSGPAWLAEDLYTSTYFQVKREFAETVTRWTTGRDDHRPRWAILSAEHDVLFPWTTVTPYDTSIDDIGDDPTDPDDRVDAHGRRRPDGQEIVTEMDQWATLVAYSLSRWLAMFRDPGGMPGTTDINTLLVLAGQSYVEPLRERGVFEYFASRMYDDPNVIVEYSVNVRFLFEEIEQDGMFDQMAWLSDAIETLGGPPRASEQTTVSEGGGRDE